MAERYYRTLILTRAASTAGALGATLATETPVRRNSYWEVLGCSPDDVDLSRARENGLPLLHQHDQGGALIGRVRELRADGKALRGKLHPATNAKASEVWRDIEAGVASDLSVGYTLDENSAQEMGRRDGLPVYKFKWAPFEASIVNVPADPRAGVGRAIDETSSMRERSNTMSALKPRFIDGATVSLSKEPAGRSLLEMIRLLERNEANWSELSPGDRGTRIENVALHRDLLTVPDSSGGYLKMSTAPTSVFAALQAALVCARAGAVTVNPGGDYSAIPRVVSVSAAGWTDPDGGSVGETTMAFGSVAVSPRLCAVTANISRELILRTGGLAEVVATRELIRALAAAFDKAALCGSGAAGQPLGVVLTPGVDSRNGATFATATATAMLSAVESGNAEPTAWITTPAVAALLRARAKNGTGSEFLIDGSGRMMNLPVYVTTGVDAGTLILGDFRQLSILAESVQIELDRTTNATTGICRLFLFGFGDIAVHHPAAFAVATSVT